MSHAFSTLPAGSHTVSQLLFGTITVFFASSSWSHHRETNRLPSGDHAVSVCPCLSVVETSAVLPVATSVRNTANVYAGRASPFSVASEGPVNSTDFPSGAIAAVVTCDRSARTVGSFPSSGTLYSFCFGIIGGGCPAISTNW